MGKQEDAVEERRILDVKIQEFEARQLRAQKAVFETSLKMYATMKKLLSANDIRGDSIMRTSIHELMNEMGRSCMGFFINEGVVTLTEKDLWPPFKRD